MPVIIYLLEDEQELSLGMLIRPKRIYNFCLLHACFVSYCYDLDTLSYTFDHISTNLLTQCTTVPVPVFCCFSILVFPHIKSAPKIREKSDKKSAQKNLPEEPKWGQRATTRGPGALVARPRGWPRQGGAWTPGGPPGCPLRLYILCLGKPTKREPFFAISPLFRRRRASEIGSTSRLLPGTLPKGGTTSGSLLSTMDASRMFCE